MTARPTCGLWRDSLAAGGSRSSRRRWSSTTRSSSPARVRRAAEPADEILVLPRTERVHWLGRDLARPDPNVGRSPTEPLAAVEVDGLRPYRQGTPASRIHWPALARGAGLIERRLQADGDSRPLVVLDARCDGPSENLDAVRARRRVARARAGPAGRLQPAAAGRASAARHRPRSRHLARRAREAGDGRGRDRPPGPCACRGRPSRSPVLRLRPADRPAARRRLRRAATGSACVVLPMALVRDDVLAAGVRGRRVSRVRAREAFPRPDQGAGGGVSSRAQVAVLPPLGRRAPRPGAITAAVRERPALRLVAFAAFGLYGVLRWASMLTRPDRGGRSGCSAVATAIVAIGVLLEGRRACSGCSPGSSRCWRCSRSAGSRSPGSATCASGRRRTGSARACPGSRAR